MACRNLSMIALLATAACRHAPPDKEARAVATPAEVRRVPAPAEIRGAWCSVVLRGSLGELGHTALYVFGPDGRYSGAVAGDDAATGIEGTYSYRPGTLSLDDGALVLKAAFVGNRLELESETAYLELVRCG